MSEKYLVDENVIINFLLGKTELFNVFDNEENIYISALSIGSLYEKAPKMIPTYDICSTDNIDCIEEIAESCRDFCSQLNQIQIDEKIALEYSVLAKQTSALETNLNDKDLWFAACAITYDLIAISQNDDLKKISGLKLFYPQ